MTADLGAVVRASGLTIVRDGTSIVEGVDLEVLRGALHVLVGPNGGGKSSVVEAILGHAPHDGEVTFDFRASGRVGYVPQSFPIDPTLPATVVELLALSRQALPVCLGVRAKVRARILALLDRVGLAGLADRRLGALSGGELRRVLLAQAIDPSPELLILDEPASGLDAASAERLEAIVREVVREGAAVLLVSHDHDQARRIADVVTWIDRRVIASGSPEEAFAKGHGARHATEARS